MSSVLEINHFSKCYAKGKEVCKDINLCVESGDIFGFIGHNGAGKSTTIRSMVGVLDFERGDILIDGISVKKNPKACKQMIAYIPDNPDIYDHLTGIQYLNFVSDIFKIPEKQRNELIKQYADEFEISNSLGDIVASYSHGMKQKLVIVSALIHNPKLLVLDEPFVGLDPKAALILKNHMKRLCSDGSAVFFSTHVLDVAQKLCNKVAIIKEGRIVACGNIDEIVGDNSLEDVFMEVLLNENRI